MNEPEQKNMEYLILMGLYEQTAIQFGKIDMKIDNTWYANYRLITWKTPPNKTSVWIAVKYRDRE